MVTARLVRALARHVRAGHPWVYREALAPFEAEPGAEVELRDDDGALARGLAEAGPIAVRLWTIAGLDRRADVDDALFAARIDAALELRTRLALPDTDALRLLHGEGDRMPGVTCDRYGEWAVLRLDGAGATARAEALRAALIARLPALGIRGLLERRGRKTTLEVCEAWGERAPEELEILERGMRLLVDPWRGQKTGMFLDHRESRALVRGLARDARVLNLYGYTGGFSIAAGLGGARLVDTVDVAPAAVETAVRAWARNGLEPRRHAGHTADVPQFLAASGAARWDLIVADPPSFAPKAAALPAALASYRKLHGACLRHLARGGLYVAASCSSHVDREAFERTLREGAEDAGVVLQVLGRWGAPADHPRLAAFPEGDYLKVVLARALA